MTHWEYLKTLDADSAAIYILSNLPKPNVRLIGRKCNINGDAFKDWLNSKILYKTSDGDYIDMSELLGDDAALTIAGLKNPNESECVTEENKELKRMLKLIFDEMQEEKRCWTCVHKKSSGANMICYRCSCSDKTMYEWKHADEVEKLLEEKE